MNQNQRHLVVGANGHLGNNLVRLLLEKGMSVRATVRNLQRKEALQQLDCEVMQADLMDQASLIEAMRDIDVLYVSAAVYKYWARDPHKEIIAVNMEGTRNILEAAAKQNVPKIIYVSSVFATNMKKKPLDASGWNESPNDPYMYSKTEAEKLALRLADEYDLHLVSILPTAMMGPHSYGSLTPTMETLHKILHNKIPINPDFNMNIVDVRDVAEAMLNAAERGRKGERYLLGQEEAIHMTDIFRIASELKPGSRIPFRSPYMLTYTLATLMEAAGRITGRQPLMQRDQVKTFYRADLRCNIDKAKGELGFDPRPAKEVLTDAFQYLMDTYYELR